ncbi:hypothetical protein HDC92_002203 [Pedobacter sp. AK017]|uniref:hypothetical protein n=1 Tax=Pedobacter sp. AK017 TaxID=2723073 RepID=UPI00161039DC|nr:hypothetical protein [Pedobacter sp. AK017]MBB5438527.1 hypothetical protein [Pedobacter sp. AK017]
MLKKKNTEDYILLIFAILGVVIIILTVFNFAFHSHVSFFGNIDNDKLSAFSGFIGGIVGTIFSATATILVWMALKTHMNTFVKPVKSKTNADA